MADRAESNRPQLVPPSLSDFVPFSTIAILVVFAAAKHELFLETLDMIASEYLGTSRTNAIFLLIAIVFTLMLITYGIWMLVYHYRVRQAALEESHRVYAMERQALTEIFHSLDGKNWMDKTRWCSPDEPVERWKGVKIDSRTGRVNKLLLADNRVAGSIPAAIGQLTYLKEIDFRFNKIRGNLPAAALTSLRYLEGLYLFDNYIEGAIPLELSRLPRLSGIYLYNNNFTNVEEARKEYQKNVKEGCIVYI
mmetsp:Transcript_17803/g.29869  ORF Transcript_17803/g.29869 Transcript_17803/m.29869 type:complete len:251 (-) Transcript_17803:566-1318(-)